MRSIFLLMLFLLVNVLVASAQAQQVYTSNEITAFNLPSAGDQAKNKGRKKKSTGKISQQQAAQKVKNRFGGKVLKVQNSKVDGHAGYKVKLLKHDGHIISVLVDGRSGKIKGN